MVLTCTQQLAPFPPSSSVVQTHQSDNHVVVVLCALDGETTGVKGFLEFTNPCPEVGVLRNCSGGLVSSIPWRRDQTCRVPIDRKSVV